jgi:hypothetical protein
MKKNDNPEYQAGAAIVDEGIQFKVPLFWGLKKTFTIRPLRPGTLVRISMQVSRMVALTENENMIHEIMQKGGNLKAVANIVAHAAINREQLTGFRLRWYRFILLNRVEKLSYLFSYLNIVFRQMDPQFFFLITASVKKMNFLETKTPAPSQEAKPSGGPLRSFSEHSD